MTAQEYKEQNPHEFLYYVQFVDPEDGSVLRTGSENSKWMAENIAEGLKCLRTGKNGKLKMWCKVEVFREDK